MQRRFGDTTREDGRNLGFAVTEATIAKFAGQLDAALLGEDIVDFGGTQQAYAMMAAPLLMGFSQEDDHRKVGSLQLDVAHTAGWQEYDKDSKDAKITAVTRYRYVITVEARNQPEDRTAMVKRLAESVAKNFEGK